LEGIESADDKIAAIGDFRIKLEEASASLATSAGEKGAEIQA